MLLRRKDICRRPNQFGAPSYISNVLDVLRSRRPPKTATVTVRSTFLEDLVTAEAVIPDSGGFTAAIKSSVEVDVECTAGVVGKPVGLGRGQIDREGSFDEADHAWHHRVALPDGVVEYGG